MLAIRRPATGFDVALLFILVVAGAIVVLSIALPIGIMWLLPGRKGKLRTEREFLIPQPMEAAWDLMAGRLEYEGFEIEEGDRPTRIVASRAMRESANEELSVTNASKPMGAEMNFSKAPGGTTVGLAMWLDDYVLFDTGEGKQIDLTMERLMTAELDKEEPPVTRAPHVTCYLGLTGGILALGLAVLPLYWQRLYEKLLMSFGIGIAIGSIYVLMMGKWAISASNDRPKEVSGKPLGYLSLALSVLGLAAGITWLVIGCRNFFWRR
jgi:hypothetical protein